jgi:hypothetical protein
MRTLVSAAAIAASLGIVGAAGAQTQGAIGETGLRPMDITCADLNAAGETERSGLVYFLAGYQAAQDQFMHDDVTTGAIGTTGTTGTSSGAADAATGSSDAGTAGAQQTTSADATSGGTATGGSEQVAAAGGEAETAGASSGTGATGATSDVAAGGSESGATAAVGADTGSSGASSGADSGGAASAGTNMAAASGSDVQSEVSVQRAFFATPVEEILAACDGNDQMGAFDAIGQARSAN